MLFHVQRWKVPIVVFVVAGITVNRDCDGADSELFTLDVTKDGIGQKCDVCTVHHVVVVHVASVAFAARNEYILGSLVVRKQGVSQDNHVGAVNASVSIHIIAPADFLSLKGMEDENANHEGEHSSQK